MKKSGFGLVQFRSILSRFGSASISVRFGSVRLQSRFGSVRFHMFRFRFGSKLEKPGPWPSLVPSVQVQGHSHKNIVIWV